MKTSLCTSVLLIASAATFSIPRKPVLFPSLPSANLSDFPASLANINATKGHRLGDWPDLPYRIRIGSFLSLSIDAYGRKAPIPRASTLMLDSINSIIHRLDSAGRPLDLIGSHLELVSYNGLVRVNIGSDQPKQRLTRLDASEVLEAVWEMTQQFGPREILLAEIEETIEYELMALFKMEFPGPVVSGKSTA